MSGQPPGQGYGRPPGPYGQPPGMAPMMGPGGQPQQQQPGFRPAGMPPAGMPPGPPRPGFPAGGAPMANGVPGVIPGAPRPAGGPMPPARPMGRPGYPGAAGPRPMGGPGVPPGVRAPMGAPMGAPPQQPRPGFAPGMQQPQPPAGVQSPPRPAGAMGAGPTPAGVRPGGPMGPPMPPAGAAVPGAAPGFGARPPGAMPPPGAAPGFGPRPPGVGMAAAAAAPGFGPPRPGGPMPVPGGFQQQQPPQPAVGVRPAVPGMRPPPPPGMGAPPPGGAMQPPPPVPGMGYDQASMSAALDSFATLSLGPHGPGMPGQQQDPSAAAAAFPRPAGPGAEELVGPPPPYAAANCKPQYVRPTTQAIPNSQALKARWHLPLGAVVHPMCEELGEVPIANPGATAIIRCKRCRTYMNPFMSWTDGGRRFVCNVCQLMNEVPVEYFCSMDASGRRLDTDQRPELYGGSVEYVAPAEYMVRPPMPPTYVFVLDVSYAAVSSGMLRCACAAIKECLDRLPGEDRTQVAFLTFDSTLHFYNLKSSLGQPQMMVVAEVEEPFVPLPDDLLVNLKESRHLVDALLDALPQSFVRTQVVESAAGPALQAAFLIMNHIGGKLLLFQAATPSLGIGRIKARDNPALYGTDREYTLRAPDDPFYKRFSAEASRFQICVDVFAFGSTYMDLPSLGALPKYTGGQLYYYPGFNADKDGGKLVAEITRNLTRETAWEAVMRIRCSKGLRINAFYGHFFIRSTDLLALPACDADKAFSVEIQHEETLLTGQVAYIQAALLYTNSNGERRIRVHTMALPVVTELVDLYKASDAGATAALLAKMSVEKSYAAKLDDVRTGVQQRLVASLREYRMLHMRGQGLGVSPNSMVLPERLKSLPVLCLGITKIAALRGSGRDVNTDERTAVGHEVTTASSYDVLKLVYPVCYPVYEPTGDWGLEGPDGRVVFPPTAPAGLEYFNPAGAYLIDNSRILVLWLGVQLHPHFYQEVFGVVPSSNAPEALNPEPVRPNSDLSRRINNMLRALRGRRELYQECYVVRQGQPMEAHVMPYFVEDRLPSSGTQGYLDFMVTLQKSVMAK